MKMKNSSSAASIPDPFCSSGSADIVWKVLAAVAKHSLTQHDYATAESYYHLSLMAAREAFGPNDFRVAVLLLDLADLCWLRNDFKLARQLNHRTKQILGHCVQAEDQYEPAKVDKLAGQ